MRNPRHCPGATPKGWMPGTSAYIHIVETAVLLGVMAHFAALLAGLVLF